MLGFICSLQNTFVDTFTVPASSQCHTGRRAAAGKLYIQICSGSNYPRRLLTSGSWQLCIYWVFYCDLMK